MTDVNVALQPQVVTILLGDTPVQLAIGTADAAQAVLARAGAEAAQAAAEAAQAAAEDQVPLATDQVALAADQVDLAEAQAAIALAAASTAAKTLTLTFATGLADNDYTAMLAAPFDGTITQIAAQVHDALATSFDLQLFVNGAPVWGDPTTVDDTLLLATLTEAFVSGDQITVGVTNSDVTAATIEITYAQTPAPAIPGMSGPLTDSDFTAIGPCLIGRTTAGAGPLEELDLVRGWTSIETIPTTSGSSVVFDNISADYTELEFIWRDVSHDSGSNQNWNIEVSIDNGTLWSSPQTLLGSAVAASAFVSGIVKIENANERIATWDAKLGASTGNPGLPSVSVRGGAIRATTVRPNAYRISVGGGAHDFGEIEMRGR
jgi:hypothetical protein